MKTHHVPTILAALWLAACSSTAPSTGSAAAQFEDQRIFNDDDCVIVLRPHANNPGPDLLVTEMASSAGQRRYGLYLESAVSGTLKISGGSATQDGVIDPQTAYELVLTENTAGVDVALTRGGTTAWTSRLNRTPSAGVRRPRTAVHSPSRRRDELDVYFSTYLVTLAFTVHPSR